MKKPTALALAAFLLLASSLYGCDAPKGGESTSPTRPTVGVLLYRGDDIYISMVFEALKRELEGKAHIIMLDAKESQLAQNEQLHKLLSGGNVNVLAVNMVDTQATAGVVDLGKKSDIPIVFFNREPDLNVLKLYAKAAFVGTNPVDAGVMQGRLIAELWKRQPGLDRNGDGRLQYLMFQGNADNPEAIARTEYSVREAREQGVEMYQLGQTYVCNWDEKLAYEAMKVAMLMHMNEIEMVISNNDSMALGVIRALAERGYNTPGGQFIPIVGVDAIPQAVEAIKAGTMSATVKQDSEAMGKAIATLLLNAAQNKDFLEDTGYTWDSTGVGIRIPYSKVSTE